jgi:S1-C subfamily serine protease
MVLTLSALACRLPTFPFFRNLSPTEEATPVAVTVPSPNVSSAPESSLETRIERVYDSTAPAVVNVTSEIVVQNFLMQAVPEEGTGSGFVYDTAGHIVTNYHVVADAESISVALAAGGVYSATVIGQDPSSDLAVLSIDADDLPAPLPVGDSDKLRVGQFVMAIGNPFGLQRTLTVGVISALSRVIESPDSRFIGEAIQTDAAVNPGNSGGPLLDLDGNVIGINAQIESPSGTSAGIGFAISASTVRRVVPQLIAEGHYQHPWMGIKPLDLTPSRAQVLRDAGGEVPLDEGMLVVEVVDGSGAARAGIRGGDTPVQVGTVSIPLGGDIITAVDGRKMSSLQDLTVYLETEKQVGDNIDVTVLRDGQELTITVQLDERPETSE